MRLWALVDWVRNGSRGGSLYIGCAELSIFRGRAGRMESDISYDYTFPRTSALALVPTADSLMMVMLPESRTFTSKPPSQRHSSRTSIAPELSSRWQASDQSLLLFSQANHHILRGRPVIQSTSEGSNRNPRTRHARRMGVASETLARRRVAPKTYV